jgi:hypothetical protein
MKARSSWRSALVSSPPNPIFSLGISRGPSAKEHAAGVPFELAAGPPGEAVDERGARPAPFINEPIPGTAFPALAGSEDFGDAAMGLREGSAAGCSCFAR